MKEITVLSGKGGTGKTTITAALASVVSDSVFCDNDVDAANLHLIFNPEIRESHTFSSGKKAFINPEKCTNCSICINNCRFDAIRLNKKNQPEINPFQCEGCRLCERICPENAISTIEKKNNSWYVSASRFGTLVHAKMGPGEENSGKLVTKIRQKAKEIAYETGAEYIINDGPPGIGCSAIASVTGSSLVLLVIEPSVSGLHDAKRLFELVASFHIPVLAVINKFDLNPDFSETVETFLSKSGIDLIGKINFSTTMVESMVAGKTVVEFAPESTTSEQIHYIWSKIQEYFKNNLFNT
jgi:MinD superfamily P-loop ATPase